MKTHSKIIAGANRALFAPVMPDPVEFYETEFILSTSDAAEHGPPRIDDAPWQAEIIRCLASEAEEDKFIALMSSSQVGKTTVITQDIFREAKYRPGPFGVVLPTIHARKTFSQDRFERSLEASHSVADVFAAKKSRDSGNTISAKRFYGGQVHFLSGKSTTALKSKPFRRLYIDEANELEKNLNSQGDTVEIAQKRVEAFGGSGKIFINSTPTNAKFGTIEKWHERGTQHSFLVPCPACSHKQKLVFSQFRYEKPEVGKNVTGVQYECTECAAVSPESDWRAQIGNGEWVARFPGRAIKSFHIWQAYMRRREWSRIATEYERVKDDVDALRVFVNQTLGESFVEATDVPWEKIHSQMEDWKIGEVPAGGMVLTAFIDVQKSRFEGGVIAWGRHESWFVDYFTIDGGPSDDRAWGRLTDFLSQRYTRADGVSMTLSAVGIDSGYDTQSVYNWARQHTGRVYVTKGANSFLAPVVVPPKSVDINFNGERISNGVQLWFMGVSQIKRELYSWFTLRPKEELIDGKRSKSFPKNYMHLPQYGEEFCRSLVSERIDTQNKRNARGKAVSWVKIFERNEVLDIAVGNRFLSIVLGLDRWGDREWDRHSMSLGPNRQQAQRPKVVQKSRVISRGVDLD